jgi:hypothetical protein
VFVFAVILSEIFCLLISPIGLGFQGFTLYVLRNELFENVVKT